MSFDRHAGAERDSAVGQGPWSHGFLAILVAVTLAAGVFVAASEGPWGRLHRENLALLAALPADAAPRPLGVLEAEAGGRQTAMEHYRSALAAFEGGDHASAREHLRRGARAASTGVDLARTLDPDGELPDCIGCHAMAEKLLQSSESVESVVDLAVLARDYATQGIPVATMVGLLIFEAALERIDALVRAERVDAQQVAATAAALRRIDAGWPTIQSQLAVWRVGTRLMIEESCVPDTSSLSGFASSIWSRWGLGSDVRRIDEVHGRVARVDLRAASVGAQLEKIRKELKRRTDPHRHGADWVVVDLVKHERRRKAKLEQSLSSTLR